MLLLVLRPNDDEELTCLVCWGYKCELMFETLGGGKRSWHGIHEKCAVAHSAHAPSP